MNWFCPTCMRFQPKCTCLRPPEGPPVLSGEDCQRRHYFARRTFTVLTDLGPVTLTDCRFCDRAQCPECDTYTFTRTQERCNQCGYRLIPDDPGSLASFAEHPAAGGPGLQAA